MDNIFSIFLIIKIYLIKLSYQQLNARTCQPYITNTTSLPEAKTSSNSFIICSKFKLFCCGTCFKRRCCESKSDLIENYLNELNCDNNDKLSSSLSIKIITYDLNLYYNSLNKYTSYSIYLIFLITIIILIINLILIETKFLFYLNLKFFIIEKISFKFYFLFKLINKYYRN